MKKIIWKLLSVLDNNWGYTTPLQLRYKRGDVLSISSFKTQNTPYDIGTDVVIIETGRHDYLVCDFTTGTKKCVYQFELN